MTHAEILLSDFDQEAANTRKVLERIPADKLEWKALPKSHTIGWNANHMADIPHWLVEILTKPSLDIAPVGGTPYASPVLTSPEEIVALFDRNIEDARKAIAGAKDEEMSDPWTLSHGGHPVFTHPRSSVARSILNHLMHHRAHLLVYLRMNDVPVPGMYGPSGDE
ncbi:DinB family protein [Singulisphaera rosea]